MGPKHRIPWEIYALTDMPATGTTITLLGAGGGGATALSSTVYFRMKECPRGMRGEVYGIANKVYCIDGLTALVVERPGKFITSQNQDGAMRMKWSVTLNGGVVGGPYGDLRNVSLDIEEPTPAPLIVFKEGEEIGMTFTPTFTPGTDNWVYVGARIRGAFVEL